MSEDTATKDAEAPAATEAATDAESKPAAQPTPSLLEEDEEELSLFGEFMLFLKEEKKWWLAPLVTVMLLLGTIIVFAESSAIAPFIYTIW